MNDSLFPKLVVEDDRLPRIHGLLLELYGKPKPREPWDPLTQFIYSLLSSRTKTEVTHQVLRHLRERFGTWENLRDAPLAEIEDAVRDVTFPEQKGDQPEGFAATDYGAVWDADAGFSGELSDGEDSGMVGAVSRGGAEDERGGGELQHAAAKGFVHRLAPSAGDAAAWSDQTRRCRGDGRTSDADDSGELGRGDAG